MCPSASRPRTTRLSAWSSRRSSSSDIAKPRSDWPAAPAPAHRLELAQLGVGELAELAKLGRVALLLQARDRLPDLADRPALERERPGLDDRLVAQVHRPEPELLPERAHALARAERRDSQAARLGEEAELAQQRRNRLVGADGVARDEEHARLDAVAEEGPSVRAEQVVLVAAELEVGERVVAVPPHELSRRPAKLDSREHPRRGERPEEEIGTPGERDQAGDADRLVEVPELVVEVERADLPEQRVAGRAQRSSRGRRSRVPRSRPRARRAAGSRPRGTERAAAPAGACRGRAGRRTNGVRARARPPRPALPAAASRSRPFSRSSTVRPRSSTSASRSAPWRRPQRYGEVDEQQHRGGDRRGVA